MNSVWAHEDPRVVASRERLLDIPWWRLIRMWHATGEHLQLLDQVIAELEHADE